jgi:hypothetical protein
VKPVPWSHSRLEDFKNCPRAFYEKQIAKSVTEEKGEATLWGERVHKHFEDFLTDGVALPQELAMHEGFLLKLMGLPGEAGIEERIALNTSGQACGFFDDDVWFRGVIDYRKINGDQALLVDHKTGKRHEKFQQLRVFALHTFIAHPEVNTVRAEYYWTQQQKTAGETYSRKDVEVLWRPFIPDLAQFAQAFRDDVWQPRQSGLCNGWCPVTGCEFWKPKRRKG